MRFDANFLPTMGTVSISSDGRTGTITGVDGRLAVMERKFRGKWYFEMQIKAGGNAVAMGLMSLNTALTADTNGLAATAQWLITDTNALYVTGANVVPLNNGGVAYTAGTYVADDVFMFAVDLDTPKLYFGRNGVWLGTSDPATNTNEASITCNSLNDYGVVPCITGNAGAYTAIAKINMHTADLAYTPPSGFTAWGTMARTAAVGGSSLYAVLSNGNRTINNVGATAAMACCDSGMIDNRKYYWEGKFDTPGAAGRTSLGMTAYFSFQDQYTAPVLFNASTGAADDRVCVTDAGLVYERNNLKYTGTAFSSSDTAQFAYDQSTGNLWVGRNNSWFGGGNPALGTLPTYTLTTKINRTFHAAAGGNTAAGAWQMTVNFGSAAPTYTPPTGFHMMGMHYETSASAAAATTAMARLRTAVATLATAANATTAFAASRRFSMTLTTAANATTAFTPTRLFYMSLATAVNAVTTMSAQALFRMALATEVEVLTFIDLTDIEYMGYVANLETGAHSVYEDFNFNSMVADNQVYYGARPDGIYVLGGATDVNGQTIAARIRTGRDVLGVDQQKRLAAVYVGIKASGTMQAKVVTDNGTVNVYNMVVANPQRSLGRAKVGKGFRSDAFQIEIANTSGIDFDADVIEVYPVILQRRVP